MSTDPRNERNDGAMQERAEAIAAILHHIAKLDADEVESLVLAFKTKGHEPTVAIAGTYQEVNAAFKTLSERVVLQVANAKIAQQESVAAIAKAKR